MVKSYDLAVIYLSVYSYSINKHAEYYENLDFFDCFGDQGSLEVAHIIFSMLFY